MVREFEAALYNRHNTSAVVHNQCVIYIHVHAIVTFVLAKFTSIRYRKPLCLATNRLLRIHCESIMVLFM